MTKDVTSVEGLSTLVFLGFMIAIFYFMLIRPQKRRVEEHRKLVEGVGVGDEVITIGGLYGTVKSIGDDELEIEAAPGTVLRFSKSAVARNLTESLEEEPAEEEELEEEAGS